jgi:lipopolysaccharide/colanic/teichoic acid biosynthesis glycosyltransferase
LASQFELRVVPTDIEPLAPPVPVRAERSRRGRPRRADAVRPAPLPPRLAWYLPLKHTLDFAIALVLCIPALPVVILAALAIKLTSRGPAFYTQVRLGKNGRPFAIFKLRTMTHQCESLTGPRWSVPGDPRVTYLGWFLRKMHLDELPQLLNVLRGEMSLVGPRPERPEFLPELEGALPTYRQRLQVRPGVTGLAQVQLPPDKDVGSVRKKLAHDLYYIRYLGPLLDLKLLICTGFYALGIPFRILSWILFVPESDRIEVAMTAQVPEVPPTARPRLAA